MKHAISMKDSSIDNINLEALKTLLDTDV
ncbi:hypothetical protein CLOSBL3_11190 [Clostridiaceae bacterium BL-3]|nr:hypothetical protein CLOSBL3_11190 [Clostridiaceae bacterium BL-3]